MKGKRTKPSGSKSSSTPSVRRLRRDALKRMADRSGKGEPHKQTDPKTLLHELEVHQIELEIQNEQLKTAQMEPERGLNRFGQLFDFAPIGYAMLSADGS